MPEPTWTDAAAGPLRADPGRAAVLLDLDGTLSPLVPDPDRSAVSQAVCEALRVIARSYALTAIVTGRPAAVARRIAGVGEISYAGNHGFELLPPGAESAQLNPAVEAHVEDAARFVSGRDLGELRLEDKGPIVALHWRRAPDPAAAERRARELADEAAAEGLVTHWGRMVLEIRAPVAIDKGVAVEGLLAGVDVDVALYAGDDRTDVDGFRALERLRDAGELERIVRLAVGSDEAPAELIAESDVVAPGADAVPHLLEALAG